MFRQTVSSVKVLRLSSMFTIDPGSILVYTLRSLLTLLLCQNDTIINRCILSSSQCLCVNSPLHYYNPDTRFE